MKTFLRFGVAALFACALSTDVRAGNLAPHLNQLLDNNGDVLNGGEVCSFLAGTSTVSQLFSDKARTTAHGDCVSLDSAGRMPSAYCDPENVLKLQIKNSAGTEQDVWDDVICPFGADDVTEARDALNLGSIVTESIGTSGDAVPKLNANNTWSAQQDFDAGILVESTSAGATAAPTIDLYRDSASPAVDDILGEVIFTGEDDGSGVVEYASLQAGILDETDATEDGELCMSVIVAGSKTEIACADSTGFDIKSGTLSIGGTDLITEFEATAQAWDDDAILTFAHGLSCTPRVVHVFAENTTADKGYTIGERVLAIPVGSGDSGLTVQVDATNIEIAISATYALIDQSTFNADSITETSWDLDVYAQCVNP